jgi:hypothetical protein
LTTQKKIGLYNGITYRNGKNNRRVSKIRARRKGTNQDGDEKTNKAAQKNLNKNVL